MDLASILVLLAVAIATGVFVVTPLMDNDTHLATEDEIKFSSLLAERDRVLDALLELDFDYTLGKVPEEIYPEQRTDLLTRAADVLKQIDERGGEQGDAVEDALAARKAARADDPLEAKIAARRAAEGKAPAEKAGGAFCHECGKTVKSDDKFCTACGAKLS